MQIQPGKAFASPANQAQPKKCLSFSDMLSNFRNKVVGAITPPNLNPGAIPGGGGGGCGCNGGGDGGGCGNNKVFPNLPLQNLPLSHPFGYAGGNNNLSGGGVFGAQAPPLFYPPSAGNLNTGACPSGASIFYFPFDGSVDSIDQLITLPTPCRYIGVQAASSGGDAIAFLSFQKLGFNPAALDMDLITTAIAPGLVLLGGGALWGIDSANNLPPVGTVDQWYGRAGALRQGYIKFRNPISQFYFNAWVESGGGLGVPFEGTLFASDDIEDAVLFNMGGQ